MRKSRHLSSPWSNLSRPKSVKNAATSFKTEISYADSAYNSSGDTPEPQTTVFTYNAAGALIQAQINAGTPATVNYVTNAAGQILSRIETGGGESVDPETYYYFVGGQQVGEITNDGSQQGIDYAQAIAERDMAPPTLASPNNYDEGPFAGGNTGPTAYAAFGDAYQPITPTSQGSSTGAVSSYTVQAGKPITGADGGQLTCDQDADLPLAALTAEARKTTNRLEPMDGG